MKSRIFIGSSVEGLEVAYAIQTNLEHDTEPTVWNQGIFAPSKYTLEAIIDNLKNSDFGVFVFRGYLETPKYGFRPSDVA